MNETTEIDPKLISQVDNNEVLPNRGSDVSEISEESGSNADPLGQGGESDSELNELGLDNQENADPNPNESPTYTKSLKIRDHAYQEAQELFDSGEINEEELLVRMSLIDSEFFTNMAMGLNLSENPTFNEVSTALKKYHEAEQPTQLLMAQMELVQDAMDYLVAQGYLNGESLTFKGMAEIKKILGEDLPEDVKINREMIEKLLSDKIPYKLVVAKFSSEVRVEELFKEQEANSHEQASEEDIPEEVEVEIDEVLNETNTQNGGDDNKDTSKVTRSEEEKITAKRRAWRAVKNHMSEGLKSSDLTEVMRLFLGMDVRDSVNRFFRSEEQSLLDKGFQVGEKDIQQSTNKGQIEQLQKMITLMLSHLTDAETEEIFGKSYNEIRNFSIEEFRSFVEENQIPEKVENLFSTTRYNEKVFVGFKKWLTEDSFADQSRRELWSNNLTNNGLTSPALKQLVQYLTVL